MVWKVIAFLARATIGSSVELVVKTVAKDAANRVLKSKIEKVMFKVGTVVVSTVIAETCEEKIVSLMQHKTDEKK